MIVFLRGTVFSKRLMYLDIEVHGIGYRVWVTERFAGKVQEQEEMFVYTYQYVREDAIVLYGFETEMDRLLFEMLLSVSGVGPKVALQIINSASVDDFVYAVQTEDLAMLCHLPGIGKKTAQRLVVELKDKLDNIPHLGAPRTMEVPMNRLQNDLPSIQADVLEALKMLGYPERLAIDTVRRVLDNTPHQSVEDALKICLQELYTQSNARR